MSATVKLKLEDLAPWLKDNFESALKRIDWARPLKVVTVMIQSAIKGYFDESRSPSGVPWKPLQQPRARSKGWGEDDRPLRDTGLLMGSVTGANAQNVTNIQGSLLTFGSNVHYAPIHHFGHRFEREGRKPFKIPARPFIPFLGEGNDDEELKEEITEYLADEIADQLMRSLERG